MTAKENIIEIIGGDQVHHLWGFLTKNGWEPQFSVYETITYFEAYNGYKWYTFNDQRMKSEGEMFFDLSKPLGEQDAETYDLLLKFLETV